MLGKMLKTQLIKWSIIYLGAAILASLIIVFFFRNASYPVGQVAAVIAIPVIVVITIVRIFTHMASGQKSKSRPLTKEEKNEIKQPRKWVQISSVALLLIFICSFVLTLTFSISSVVYLLADLEWATKATLQNIAIPSLWVAGYSFFCLLIIIGCFIIEPYWHRIINTIRKRIAIWSEITRDVRINGYSLRLHR